MQNSVKNDQEKQDRSEKTAMEESTAMTIEFLRARLLSERSISRTARQRADELAKRVVDLEEQLKLVSLQRKKAEKATTEVLAILENSGISDLSNAYDSSSDQEVGELKKGDAITKEEVSLTTSRPMGIKVEFSSLELGGSPLTGRSLSWESCCDSANSVEKKKNSDQVSSNFVSTSGSSTRHHLAKPRRHIKRRETRSASVVTEESILPDTQENAIPNGSGDVSNCLPEISKEGCKGEFIQNLVQGCPEDQRKESNDGFSLNGSERDAEMERALEHQARLIVQFEAEENAQREWEEKFRDNNSCTPDSCEPGNQSDVTEERDENRAETAEAIDNIPSRGQGGKSGTEEVRCNGDSMPKSHPDRFLHNPHHGNGYSQEKQYSSSTVTQSPSASPEFSFPGQKNLEAKSNEKRKLEWSDNNSICSPSYGSSEHQSGQKYSSFNVGENIYRGDSSGNGLQVVTHHEIPNGLGGVLDALQRAKLSLKHELNRLPLSSGGGPVSRTMEPPVPAITAGDALEIPVGSGGLFRVPDSFQFKPPVKPNLLTPYPDFERSLTRSYPGSRVGAAADDRYTSSAYSDRGSVNSTHRPLSDSYMDRGMGPYASSRYTYSSYADSMQRLSRNDGFPRIYPSDGQGMPAQDRYSVYNDQIRSNMYKYNK